MEIKKFGIFGGKYLTLQKYLFSTIPIFLKITITIKHILYNYWKYYFPTRIIFETMDVSESFSSVLNKKLISRHRGNFFNYIQSETKHVFDIRSRSDLYEILLGKIRNYILLKHICRLISILIFLPDISY